MLRKQGVAAGSHLRNTGCATRGRRAPRVGRDPTRALLQLSGLQPRRGHEPATWLRPESCLPVLSRRPRQRRQVGAELPKAYDQVRSQQQGPREPRGTIRPNLTLSQTFGPARAWPVLAVLGWCTVRPLRAPPGPLPAPSHLQAHPPGAMHPMTH